MVTKIDKKIVGYSVKTEKAEAEPKTAQVEEASPAPSIVKMHETLERPEELKGSTIKLKNAAMDHAYYLTINYIVLNEGTEFETIRPFEVFVNTKDQNSTPWITALTRMISAAWRKGGDFAFVIDELKAVHDPRGGCFLPGGVYVPSTVAHIGLAIEQHLQSIGALKAVKLSAEVRAMQEAKLAALRGAAPAADAEQGSEQDEAAAAGGAVAGATLCGKCSNMAVVVMDGCETCLSCGYSKCG